MPLIVGQVIQQRYRIEALLGQGGMGAVYRATDQRFNATVAVKENLDTSSVAQRQFAREAGILHHLRHPNLPRVGDYFVIPGQGQYLVMDFIEGQDLSQILANGPVPEDAALIWIRQVLDALEYLHNQDPPVIHRDVKPANVKITPRGQVYLVDFGLVKIDPILRTTTGAHGVTPGYAPPEQYGQGRTDARSDLYAVGATLYALLTGKVPPDGVDLMMGNAALAPPRQINPNITPATEKAILDAMQSHPTERPQTVGELRAKLSTPRLTRQVPERERPGSVPRVVRRSRSLWLGIAGALVLALALGWGGLQLLAPQPGPTPAPTRVVAASATFTRQPQPTDTSVLVPTRTPTPTSSPTGTPTYTPTPRLTVTPIPTPVPTKSPTMTSSPAPTPTPAPTNAPVPTRTVVVKSRPNRIAFSSGQSGNWELYTISPNGSDLLRLTASPATERSPEWSSDGRRIAYVAERDSGWSIYAMNADGSNTQFLTDIGSLRWTCRSDSETNCGVLAWSPDSQQLAFHSGGADILVMGADASNPRRLVSGGHPTWSPDGQHIAFSSGNSFISVIELESGAERQLTFQRFETGTKDGSPAWSPDGRQIAFDSNGDGIWGIYVMNADGSAVRRLTDHGGMASGEPAWSPDGRRIAFAIDGWQAPGGQIFVMDADGSNVQFLVQGLDPDWSP